MTLTRARWIPSPLTIGLGIVLLFTCLIRPATAGEYGSLIVELRDQDGALLGDGCFLAEGYDVGPVCDNDPNDSNLTPGLVRFGELLPGEWVVSQVAAPAGFEIVGDAIHLVSIESGEIVTVAFENAPIELGIVSTFPDVNAEVRPPDQPHQPIATAPPARIDLTPTCGGVPATIVAATSASGVPTKIVGTNGDDVIVGTAGPDLISGLGGHDTICSLDGADTVAGGDGDDWIEAGPGDDTIAGSAGVDHLDGGPGKRDACDGGAGSDTAAGCETTTAIP